MWMCYKLKKKKFSFVLNIFNAKKIRAFAPRARCTSRGLTLIVYKDINYIKKLQQHNTHKIIIKQSVKHSTT